MEKQNYFVSVFIGGKSINSFFSEKLDDLVTVNALYKGGEICIFDLTDFTQFTPEQVRQEILCSAERWQKSRERQKKASSEERKEAVSAKPKKTKPKKYWERPVLCVETGQVFGSIRECCEHLGLSHKSIWNAINSGNARNGLHFTNATKP